YPSVEAYVKFCQDSARLRQVPAYLAIGEFSFPPKISDLKDLTLNSDEIKSLRTFKPGECPFQLPATAIDKIQHSTDWSAPDLVEHINQMLRDFPLIEYKWDIRLYRNWSSASLLDVWVKMRILKWVFKRI
ncbi:MAG: hypothetical protein H6Q04_3323, partial [Acidobacteria bacterium]|nr:hypothetical protein [Acidobacteriota bacterium]